MCLGHHLPECLTVEKAAGQRLQLRLMLFLSLHISTSVSGRTLR